MPNRGLTDLRKLRHVVGVAHAGSFTSASHALNITQSALTKSVAEVEHQLGLALFERLPRGVRLTQIGEAFVPRAERLLADSEDLMADMDQLQSLAAGHLKIGIAPAAFAGFLEHTVSAFAQVYPGVSIDIRDGSPDEMARGAINGQLDLVVGGANNFAVWKELETVSVAPLHPFFIGRLDHPVQATEATAQALLKYPVIMPALGITSETQLHQAYLDAGMTPRAPQYVCDHFPLVRMIVAATQAISPVVSLAAPGRRYRSEFQVYEDVISLEAQVLGLAFSRTRPQSPGVRAFVDIFQGFLQDSKV